MTDLKIPLFFTRYAIAAFLAPWIALRFADGGQGAANIAAKYYKISSFSSALGLTLAVGWALLWLAFVTGYKSKWSYGLVLALHTFGTIMTIPWLIPGGEYNQLFWAAVPVIGAMWLLWALREQDTIFSFNG